METKLYVGNLSYSITESELRALFEECGTVQELVLITDKPTGRPKGFGFVTMGTQEEADQAISQLNGKMVGGREMKVNKARPREEGGNRGGFNRGGNRGGGNRGGGYNNNRRDNNNRY